MIDTHQHFWNYSSQDYPWIAGEFQPLGRDYLLSDLRPDLVCTGVSGLVTVQACHTISETDWLLDLADAHQEILGVVGWAPLTDERVDEVLARMSSRKKLRGIRHILQDEADEEYMLRPDFRRGIRWLRDFNLAYDILVSEHQLPQTIEFVRMHSDQVFVLDHIANPRIREQILSPWCERLTELGALPNLYCKVSGMVTEASWDHWTDRDLAPYFDIVLDIFGPKRLMFGSDWPVLTLASSYSRWVETFREVISDLSREEQDWITHRTAVEVYRLNTAT